MKKLFALFICLFSLALGGCAKDSTFSSYQAIQNQETYSYVLRTRVVDVNVITDDLYFEFVPTIWELIRDLFHKYIIK